MAEKMPGGPVELGAEMDYEEHEKTYSRFLLLAKYGSLHVIALLIAMAFGFFTDAGFFSAFILFAVITVAGILFIRRVPRHVA
jgi:hypothetical protein